LSIRERRPIMAFPPSDQGQPRSILSTAIEHALLRALTNPKIARLIVSRDALLSVSEAARLLRCRDADARAAIRAEKLERRINGLVRWGDVLDEVAPRVEDEPVPVPRGVRRLNRAKL
jgi:hypothetical protein